MRIATSQKNAPKGVSIDSYGGGQELISYIRLWLGCNPTLISSSGYVSLFSNTLRLAATEGPESRETESC